MILFLFLSYALAQTALSDCHVRVDLPFSFREHTPRFRGQGFQVNGSAPERLVVQGVYATGNVRLGSLIIKRTLRGESVEVGRVNAQFMQGLPSQMIARAIPIIQAACSEAFVESATQLCPINVPQIKEVKNFSRSQAECDIFKLSGDVIKECEAEGYKFCFADTRDYEEDTTNQFNFRGRNCKVVVSGKKYHSEEELRHLRCEILEGCFNEILSSPQLNTTYRRERLEKDLNFYSCENALSVNQQDRAAESATSNSGAPGSRSQARPE